MERVNREIKTFFGISFGSTNFVRVRNRIIYSINEDAPILAWRKTKSNKRLGKARGRYNIKKYLNLQKGGYGFLALCT